MDSGIDLNPPPWVFFSRKTIPSFGKGKVLGVALALCWASSRACSFFLENPTAWLQICNLGQPLINCSYGAMSKWPAWLEMRRSGHLAPF